MKSKVPSFKTTIICVSLIFLAMLSPRIMGPTSGMIELTIGNLYIECPVSGLVSILLIGMVVVLFTTPYLVSLIRAWNARRESKQQYNFYGETTCKDASRAVVSSKREIEQNRQKTQNSKARNAIVKPSKRK